MQSPQCCSGSLHKTKLTMGRTLKEPPNQRVYTNPTPKQQRSVYITELNDINETSRRKVNKIKNEFKEKIQNVENDATITENFMTDEAFDRWMAKYDEEPDERKRKIKQQRLMSQYTCVSTLLFYHMRMIESHCCLTHILNASNSK